MSAGIFPSDRAAFLGIPQDYYVCEPSNTADLPIAGRGFEVRGDAGDVKVVNGAGREVTIADVQQGERFIGGVTKVFETGTDATSILILV